MTILGLGNLFGGNPEEEVVPTILVENEEVVDLDLTEGETPKSEPTVETTETPAPAESEKPKRVSIGDARTQLAAAQAKASEAKAATQAAWDRWNTFAKEATRAFQAVDASVKLAKVAEEKSEKRREHYATAREAAFGAVPSLLALFKKGLPQRHQADAAGYILQLARQGRYVYPEIGYVDQAFTEVWGDKKIPNGIAARTASLLAERAKHIEGRVARQQEGPKKSYEYGSHWLFRNQQIPVDGMVDLPRRKGGKKQRDHGGKPRNNAFEQAFQRARDDDN
ncbi:hypothetical protein L0Y46_04005 [bacterium]|nr:hypothetical protein [bacterium]